MFDGAEMGLFSMVGRPAIKDLLGTSNDAEIGLWFGIITAGFLVGAATGGVLFGWLGDRVGRVKAMTLSVLTYAVFTGLCGVATSAWQVGALRFIAALGMGGEWSLGRGPGDGGLAESIARVHGGLDWRVGQRRLPARWLSSDSALAAVLSEMEGWLLGLGLSQQIVERLVANSGWRLMMITGTLPALLTFFIRMFVPESERWRKEESRGATVHWASVDLLGVVLRSGRSGAHCVSLGASRV